jgi:glycosyltransferase involved in cell wall biosynthesis
MEATGQERVVLVHDWLTGMRGGENCLEMLCRRWPHADLFTLLHRPGWVSPAIERCRIRTSFLQRLPGSLRYYRYLLPAMPWAVSRWRLPACELVVSLSHCVAKGVQPPPGVPHVCYCFTPMRYAWHMQEAYFAPGRVGRGRAWLADRVLERLRHWDRQSAQRVSHFVAISRTVQQRIEECYGRASVVIYPPVDTDFYCPADVSREDYYLAVSAFAPYKRLDLAIAACNRLRRTLVIVGTGQEEARLRALAGPTVHFLGWQPGDVIRDHYRRCRALLFPGEEDFGIVPVEAMACGTPVIAFGRGGATETVLPLGGERPATGLWFQEQSLDCLVEALAAFELNRHHFNPLDARRQALRFHQRRFADELFSYLDEVVHGSTQPLRRAA